MINKNILRSLWEYKENSRDRNYHLRVTKVCPRDIHERKKEKRLFSATHVAHNHNK